MVPLGERVRRNIAALSDARGWSQSELARQAGVSRSALSLISNGERSASLETIQKVAHAFGIGFASLLFEGAVDGMAALTAEEEDLVNAYRGLELDDAKAQALQLIQLDADGRRLVSIFAKLPADGKRRLVREARKIEIDFEADEPT